MKTPFIYDALILLCQKIEECGASPELTDAVSLCSDLASAVGNEFNPPDKYAAERVAERLEPTPKQIDLSVLAGQQVLCEFKGGQIKSLGFLTAIEPYEISTKHDKVYIDNYDDDYIECCPLLNYEQVYTGQTFPDGLVVEYGYKIRSGTFWHRDISQNSRLQQYFRIRDIKEGYTL